MEPDTTTMLAPRLEPDISMLTPRLEQTRMLEVKDEIKEEPKTPAMLVESYVEEPRFAPPLTVCDVPEGLAEVREPTIAQLLQEKALYSFSEWPKDRVIINRIDSICHAILKGKWPSTNQQYESTSSLPNTCVSNSAPQRTGYIPARVQPTQSLNFNISAPVSHLQKESLVSVPFLAELKRGQRRFEFEGETPGKPCHAGEKMPVGLPHRGRALLLNGWQEAAMDLSKAGELGMGPGQGAGPGAGPDTGPVGHMTHQAHPAPHKLPPLSSMQGSLGLDMAGILQAGLIHPVTGQIVNGNIRRDDAVMRRRRGRRRNVEGPDISFIKNRGLHVPEQQSRPESVSQAPAAVSSSSSSSSSAPQPEQPEGPVLDREAANKSLMEWLRQNPSYTMEVPAFAPSQNVGILHGFVERPKQRRHRCKDPSKLDVNSLTGEERVPVVHRATGRRLGGAMAPAIKELSRWLDANTDYCVAPDWADIVKHSGFLPEGKFTRILTEPVCRDVGPRRRGRRPRSEMTKPGAMLAESHSGMGPLFMNGLIGSMDLVSLQNLRNVPGIPLTGLMGFPHGSATVPAGEDAKNGLSMLPMMLHGMAAVQPHMFSVGGLMSQPATSGAPSSASTAAVPPATTGAPPSASSSSSASPATTAPTATAATSTSSSPATTCAPATDSKVVDAPAGTENRKDYKPPPGEGKPSPVCGHRESPAPTGGNSGSNSGNGSHLAFNPFLIPGISGSPKRKKKKVTREEGAPPEACGGGVSPSTDSAPLPKPDGAGQTEAAPEAGRKAGAEDSTEPPETAAQKGAGEEEATEDKGDAVEKLKDEEKEDAGKDLETQ
ncbi:hypothetical protein AGOR_G00066710 [Albula goreensis]|uniref:BRK domain-containing protein n=1 Tax=Albula goreensis TaxID=1534307 RepID=A0A8T3DZ21_9TELE|nr:hypothetical protein AGOR_G00066710 [Albula goreensis]